MRDVKVNFEREVERTGYRDPRRVGRIGARLIHRRSLQKVQGIVKGTHAILVKYEEFTMR